MLDFFAIFSKGGIVLWYFQGTTDLFTSSVNALIRSVILQERGGAEAFTHGSLALKHRLDNEFELVFVVAYQRVLQLSYVDKFLTDIQLEFRDKYRNELHSANISRNIDFTSVFKRILFESEEQSRRDLLKPKKMKTFEESLKSKKTVSSMIENKKDEGKSKGKLKKAETVTSPVVKEPVISKIVQPAVSSVQNGEIDPDQIMKNRIKFMNRMENKATKVNKSPISEAPSKPKKKAKQSTKWDHGGTNKDMKDLDFSHPGSVTNGMDSHVTVDDVDVSMVGQGRGDLRDMEEESSGEEEEDEEGEDIEEDQIEEDFMDAKRPAAKGGSVGMFSMFKNLVGSKTLSDKDIQPALEKMKEHLIGKNVAVDIAQKLCDSVACKLEGRVLGTFSGVASTVKQTLHESCVQILSPRRRIDILRDAMEVKQKQRRPYVVTFCGVNGVGKSTNLAKVTFWLIENGLRVLIAACDTFRAGAVEQLRTHERKLNALHPPERHNGVQMARLYEKGYGKDSAGIAMEAIHFARESRFDVVLIDTAGRMQDNEPLMRALAKLVKINQPDLVLFVGEALVGNEAVDQLVKFNQALADHSNIDQPRLIDGIILTKFDTIDDKVGAAISMTYITGQPIVFVGTGQTYTDLKNLNAKAVVTALLK